jgi:hypothetical protein
MTRGRVGQISVRANVIRGANRCLGRALDRPNYIRAAWSFTRETSPSAWPSTEVEWDGRRKRVRPATPCPESSPALRCRLAGRLYSRRMCHAATMIHTQK